jgi:hypothetical protein
VGTAGCFLQGDVRTKVKTPGAGKYMVGEALHAPLFPGPGFMPGPQQVGSCFLIQFTSVCLLIGELRVLTFRVIKGHGNSCHCVAFVVLDSSLILLCSSAIW